MGEEEKKEEKKEELKEKPNDEKKAAEEPPAPPLPPPPPQEIVLKVFMHCEGCARKVRRCLKGFPGVEGIQTDCKTHKVVVKGENADPLKVLERVQSKSRSPVELLSPIPPPPKAQVEEPKKPDEIEEVKTVEVKIEEPQVMIVVLGVHMHCEACAEEIKKRIQKMEGVESAEPDLKSSQVTVKGVFDPPKLVEFIHKRTGKIAAIVKVESEKKAEEKPKDEEKEKAEKEAKKGEEDGKEKKEGGGDGAEQPPKPAAAEAEQPQQGQDDVKAELKKNEFLLYQPQFYHPQRYVQDLNAYPPQIFSDENPNACSVM